jgi:uncharacterized protein YjbI with pentapeptide repeats
MSDGGFHRNDFTGANLSGANLTRAIVPRGVFKGANLTGTDFSQAFLYRSRFEGVDLAVAKGLTQHQLDEACGDATTKLPDGITMPKLWPCGED